MGLENISLIIRWTVMSTMLYRKYLNMDEKVEIWTYPVIGLSRRYILHVSK